MAHKVSLFFEGGTHRNPDEVNETNILVKLVLDMKPYEGLEHNRNQKIPLITGATFEYGWSSSHDGYQTFKTWKDADILAHVTYDDKLEQVSLSVISYGRSYEPPPHLSEVFNSIKVVSEKTGPVDITNDEKYVFRANARSVDILFTKYGDFVQDESKSILWREVINGSSEGPDAILKSLKTMRVGFQHMKNLTSNADKYADAWIVGSEDEEGTKIPCFKFILAGNSEVFDRMFQAEGMTEASTGVVKLNGADKTIAELFWNFCRIRSTEGWSDDKGETAFKLFKLGSMYNIDDMVNAASDIIVTHNVEHMVPDILASGLIKQASSILHANLTISNVFEVLEHAHKNEVKDLVENCIRFVAHTEGIHSSQFRDLEKELSLKVRKKYQRAHNLAPPRVAEKWIKKEDGTYEKLPKNE